MRLYMAGKSCCMEDILPGITNALKENFWLCVIHFKAYCYQCPPATRLPAAKGPTQSVAKSDPATRTCAALTSLKSPPS